MRAFEFVTGHVIYNPAYAYKFQLKTTKVISHFTMNLVVALEIIVPFSFILKVEKV